MNLDLRAADAYCRVLTRGHYENFSVASRFVDAARRRDLMRIYAFCRTTDDLGDETPAGNGIGALERWRDEVRALFGGNPPVHPVLVALAQTIEHRALPSQPFLDLIAANVQDQNVKRYATGRARSLLHALRRAGRPHGAARLRHRGCQARNRFPTTSASACSSPTTRRTFGATPPSAAATCWNPKSRRATRPAPSSAWCAARGPARLRQAARTVGPRALRLQLALYRLGGLAICDAIEKIGYRTEQNARAFRPQRRSRWCCAPQ